MFDFKTQLKVGDRGEELFIEHYPRKLTVYDGRQWDFTVSSTGETIELKTDTYNMDKTENFFFERYSNIDLKTPGGPWRAKEDKVNIFCYYFVRHNLWYEFRHIPNLVKRLDILSAKSGLIYIKNRGWITAGYKIKREDVEDLSIIYEF